MIKLRTDVLMEEASFYKSTKNQIESINNGIKSIRNHLDYRISSNYSISLSFRNIICDLNNIDKKMNNLSSVLSLMSSNYESCENKITNYVNCKILDINNLGIASNNSRYFCDQAVTSGEDIKGKTPFIESDNECLTTPGGDYIYFSGVIQSMNAYDKTYGPNGYKIVRQGKYAIVKNAGSEAALNARIKGTRYNIEKIAENYKNDPLKYEGIARNVNKAIGAEYGMKDALSFEKGAGGWFTAGQVLVDGINDVVQGEKNGYKTSQIVADVAVDAVADIGTSVAIGAAVGSVIPVVGTVAGAVIGLALGIVANKVLNGFKFSFLAGKGEDGKYESNRSVLEAAKVGVGGAFQGIAKGSTDIFNKIKSNFIVGNAIQGYSSSMLIK